ncbi:hypothetical protein FHW31_002878 [Enterobacter asburiae]|nr:hypothetical protein [Enterobacter asburiae]
MRHKKVWLILILNLLLLGAALAWYFHTPPALGSLRWKPDLLRPARQPRFHL